MVHPEDTTVRYDPLSGPPRRIRFQPRDDGRYRRSTQVWTGCRWRETGSEVVEDLSVVMPDSRDDPQWVKRRR